MILLFQPENAFHTDVDTFYLYLKFQDVKDHLHISDLILKLYLSRYFYELFPFNMCKTFPFSRNGELWN